MQNIEEEGKNDICPDKGMKPKKKKKSSKFIKGENFMKEEEKEGEEKFFFTLAFSTGSWTLARIAPKASRTKTIQEFHQEGPHRQHGSSQPCVLARISRA